MDSMNTHPSALCKGYLKQQGVEESTGLYCWSRKYFVLFDNGDLETRREEHSSEGDVVSILGTVAAKEWKVSSPTSGYGFDLLWASRKVWSFLSVKKEDCVLWVSMLSKVIAERNLAESPKHPLIALTPSATENVEKALEKKCPQNGALPSNKIGMGNTVSTNSFPAERPKEILETSFIHLGGPILKDNNFDALDSRAQDELLSLRQQNKDVPILFKDTDAANHLKTTEQLKLELRYAREMVEELKVEAAYARQSSNESLKSADLRHKMELQVIVLDIV